MNSENAKHRESGQMAVELAVALPIVFMVMVIAMDCMVFVSESARFENLAPQTVIAYACSPNRSNYDEAKRVKRVEKALSAEFSAHNESVTVNSADAGLAFAGIRVYEFELNMAPWPLAKGGIDVFGVHVPTELTHTYRFAFDPYTPGQLL